MIDPIMKVLIVEDNPNIAKQLSTHLEESGFVTHISTDGEDGCYQGEVEDYDAVLLDLGLPSMDGYSILETWRSAGKTMPVIILTARTTKMETIRGLEAGADDYIYKPFDMDEVTVRIRANIRRHKGQLKQEATFKNVRFDMRSGRFSKDGAYIKLTRIEFLMLQYLFMKQGQLVGMTELAEHVYDDFDHDSSIIARHIANIRKKIGTDIIQTESNRGYCVPNEEA